MNDFPCFMWQSLNSTLQRGNDILAKITMPVLFPVVNSLDSFCSSTQFSFVRTRSVPPCLQGWLAQRGLWKASAGSEATPEKAGWGFSRVFLPKNCQETSLGAPPFPGELISRAFPRVQHSSLGPLQFAPRPKGLPSSLTLNLPCHCGLTQWLLASVWTWQLSLTMTWYGNTLFKHWCQWQALMHAIQKLFVLREVFWMYSDCYVSALVLAKDDFCSSQKKHGWDTEIVLYHPRSLLGLLGKVPTVWVDVAEGVVG